ncbi:hypothetical protein SFR_5704 [Streptomyces sp. FR-008]|nr:hypothetical protein SFR_5704 [Streptomyces sp. FR-008]
MRQGLHAYGPAADRGTGYACLLAYAVETHPRGEEGEGVLSGGAIVHMGDLAQRFSKVFEYKERSLFRVKE